MIFFRTSLAAQMVKRLSAMWETWVQPLGCWEDPLETEMATHSSTLAWKIPWMEEPGGLQSMGLQRVGHDWETSLHFVTREKLVSWSGCRLEKNFQMWNRMRGKYSLLQWEMLLEREVSSRENWQQGSLVHFYAQGTRSGIVVGMWVICWLDKAHILDGGREE